VFSAHSKFSSSLGNAIPVGLGDRLSHYRKAGGAGIAPTSPPTLWVPGIRGSVFWAPAFVDLPGVGSVEYFGGDQETLDRLMSDVEEKSGYSVQAHWLQFFACAPNAKRKIPFSHHESYS